MRYNSIIDLIGDTPLVRLNRLSRGATVWVKLESANPGGSVKDRPALNMLRRASERGELQDGGSIIEASSGNLGTALAMIGAALNYDVHIMIDNRTPKVNADMIRAYGATAELVTKPDPNGKFQVTRIQRARELALERPGAFMPNQWYNPDNPAAHTDYTAQEILKDLDGQVDAVVCTASSCGQVTGIGRAMRQHAPQCRIVAVDGKGSVGLGGPRGHHKIKGFGSSFTPGNFDRSVIDDVYWSEDIDGITTCHLLARHEGLLLGGSAGAAVFFALKTAEALGPDHHVVAIAPDGGERYLDTIYDEQWLAENGFEINADIDALYQRMKTYAPFAGQLISVGDNFTSSPSWGAKRTGEQIQESHESFGFPAQGIHEMLSTVPHQTDRLSTMLQDGDGLGLAEPDPQSQTEHPGQGHESEEPS